jgi:hypothetical protein
MSKIEIIDNFLNKDDFEELKVFLMSPRSQWRFVDFIAHKVREIRIKIEMATLFIVLPIVIQTHLLRDLKSVLIIKKWVN